MEGVAFLLVMSPLNASVLADGAGGASSAAAAYGAGLRGGFSAIAGVNTTFVLVAGATGGATGVTLAFTDSDPVNTAGNVGLSLDAAVDALEAGALTSPAPAAPSSEGRRLAAGAGVRGRRAARAHPRTLEVIMSPVDPPAPLKPGQAGVSFTVIAPGGATALVDRLKALTAADYGLLNATLLAATAGLPNPPTAFALAVPSATVRKVTVTRRRWAWLLDFLRSRQAWALGGGAALTVALCVLCYCRLRVLRSKERALGSKRLAAAAKKADAVAALRRKMARVRAFNALRKWARITTTVAQMHVRAVLNPSPRARPLALAPISEEPADGGGGSSSATATSGSPGGAHFRAPPHAPYAPAPPQKRSPGPDDVPPPPRRSPLVNRSPPPAPPAVNFSPAVAPLAPIVQPLSPPPHRARARTPPPPLAPSPPRSGATLRRGGAAPGSRLDDASPLTGARWGTVKGDVDGGDGGGSAGGGSAGGGGSPYAAPLGGSSSRLLNLPGSARGAPLSPGALLDSAAGSGSRGGALPMRRGVPGYVGLSARLGGSDASGSSRDSPASALDTSPSRNRSVMLHFSSNSPVGDGALAPMGRGGGGRAGGASPPAALRAGGPAAYATAAARGGGTVAASRLPVLRPAASRAGSLGTASVASRLSSRGTIARAGATSLEARSGASALAADPAALAASSAGTARVAGAAAARSQAGAARAASVRGSGSSPGQGAGGFNPNSPPEGGRSGGGGALQHEEQQQEQGGAAPRARPETASDGEDAAAFDV
jgi:hypothetical protein